MRISDWSSDVCSSDLFPNLVVEMLPLMAGKGDPKIARIKAWVALMAKKEYAVGEGLTEIFTQLMAYNMKKKSNRDDLIDSCAYGQQMIDNYLRSEEHTSELQSLMRISYAVFCLTKK